MHTTAAPATWAARSQIRQGISTCSKVLRTLWCRTLRFSGEPDRCNRGHFVHEQVMDVMLMQTKHRVAVTFANTRHIIQSVNRHTAAESAGEHMATVNLVHSPCHDGSRISDTSQGSDASITVHAAGTPSLFAAESSWTGRPVHGPGSG